MSTRAPEPSPRPVALFDQGLFLLHLNCGKEEMRKGHYDLARRELEEALKLRARDPEVLSHLAFTLFHLGHFEEAESMTRQLLATHAESVPLLFNLGLILFKSGRDAEAREALERVVALAPAHRKAHLTLGLVLQRQRDGEGARRHLRLAGADRRPGSVEDDTVSKTARHAVEGRAGGPSPPPVKPDPLSTGEVLGLTAETTAPITPPTPTPASRAASAPTGPFALRSAGFLQADARAGVHVHRAALAGRTGALTFEPDRRLTGPLEKLFVLAAGEGSLLLSSRGRRIVWRRLRNEFLSVEPGRLLAFESSLSYREDPAFELRSSLPSPFVKLFGRGAVALAVTAELVDLHVKPEEPLTLATRTVVGYGGDVVPELLEERDAMAEIGAGPVLRFLGSGVVLVDGG